MSMREQDLLNKRLCFQGADSVRAAIIGGKRQRRLAPPVHSIHVWPRATRLARSQWLCGLSWRPTSMLSVTGLDTLDPPVPCTRYFWRSRGGQPRELTGRMGSMGSHKVSAPLRRTFSYILTTSKQTRSSYLPSGEYSGNVRHPRYNWIPLNGVTSGSDRTPGIVPLHWWTSESNTTVLPVLPLAKQCGTVAT